MAIAPALIGDCMIAGNNGRINMLAIINVTLNAKHVQHAAVVTFLEYNEYMNGARNAPAIAPHDMPIICAMKLTELLYWINASTADIAMNMTIKTRIKKTCFASDMSFAKLSLMRSIANVELDAITNDDSVDIDADNTKMTIMAIIPADNPDSIVGMIESKPLAAMSI